MRPDTADKQPMRILIIDDHEVSRAALLALLRTEGFDVVDARAGDAAITAAVTFRPGVAVVDVTPARPAGFRIASQLRGMPDAPVVLLTSSARRSLFGPELDRYAFLAKADLCGQAITNLARPRA